MRIEKFVSLSRWCKTHNVDYDEARKLAMRGKWFAPRIALQRWIIAPYAKVPKELKKVQEGG